MTTTDRPGDGHPVDPAGADPPAAAHVLSYPTRFRVVRRRAELVACLILVAGKIIYVDGLGPASLGTDTAVISLALSVLLTVGNWTWVGRPSVSVPRSSGTDHAPRSHRVQPVPDTAAANALTRAAEDRSRVRHHACLAMLVSAQTHSVLVDHAHNPFVVGICTAFSGGVAALAVVEVVRHRRLEVAAGHVLPPRERSARCT